MATLSKDSRTGAWRILFHDTKGDRRTVFLGKVPKRFAEEAQHRVAKLNELAFTRGAMTPDLARWVSELDYRLADKLARVGLIDKREALPDTCLKAFCDERMRRMQNASAAVSTLLNWQNSFRKLVEFLGERVALADVTPAQSESYREALKRAGLSDPTIHKHIQHAHAIFNDAIERRLVQANPFAKVAHPKGPQNERKATIPVDDVLLVMEHSNEVLRVMLALARFGGLRVPSEPFSLRWDDIDFERRHMVITSPKLKGKPNYRRGMPLFPSLRNHLERYRDTTPSPDGWLVPLEYRSRATGKNGWRGANLRTPLLRAIKRAGLKPWPRLWHALRGSRETELMTKWGYHAVEWIGNSEGVAMKHYFNPLDPVQQAAREQDAFDI